MNYLSVKETAVQWGVSAALVRRYCKEGRIPKAVLKKTGRLILFKECLRHGVMPFILDDKRRGAYLEGLRKWDEDRTVLLAVAGEAQARFEHQIDQHILLAQGKRFAPKDLADENEE